MAAAEEIMLGVKLTQALCLMLLTAPAVSVLQAQDNRPALGGANTVPAPAASESSPKPPVGMPAEPLRVVCKGNQLTVAANDSTLASILNEVQKCTGAKIDIPAEAAEIRFFDTIGPLPIQEGLSVLLTASGYNFVIQSSDSDPDKVEAVLLMARATSPDADPANERSLTTARRAFLKMRQDALTEAGITDENNSSAPAETSAAPVAQLPSATTENAAVNANVSSDANQGATASSSAANTTPSSQASDAAPTPSQSKTVEDQITNMEQMFEQRRQMMQTPPSTPQH
jgi:hypothetical protein